MLCPLKRKEQKYLGKGINDLPELYFRAKYYNYGMKSKNSHNFCISLALEILLLIPETQTSVKRFDNHSYL